MDEQILNLLYSEGVLKSSTEICYFVEGGDISNVGRYTILLNKMYQQGMVDRTPVRRINEHNLPVMVNCYSITPLGEDTLRNLENQKNSRIKKIDFRLI